MRVEGCSKTSTHLSLRNFRGIENWIPSPSVTAIDPSTDGESVLVTRVGATGSLFAEAMLRGKRSAPSGAGGLGSAERD